MSQARLLVKPKNVHTLHAPCKRAFSFARLQVLPRAVATNDNLYGSARDLEKDEPRWRSCRNVTTDYVLRFTLRVFPPRLIARAASSRMASLRTVAPTASGLRVNLRSAKSVLPVRRSARALAVRAQASKQEEVGFQASMGGQCTTSTAQALSSAVAPSIHMQQWNIAYCIGDCILAAWDEGSALSWNLRFREESSRPCACD